MELKDIPELRPHHILCIHAFKGGGYNNEFILNMTETIEKVKELNKFKMVFSVDTICSKCPELVNNTQCSSNKKVLEIDKSTIRYFNLEEKIYKYTDIKGLLTSLTADIQYDICNKCSWFNSGNCMKEISRQLNI